MEQIGLQAVFQDAQFKQGIAAYDKAVLQAGSTTDAASKKITASAAGIGKSWSEVAREVGQASAVMGGAVTALLTKLTLAAAPIEGVTQAFEIMADRAGLSLERLDQAAAGTITTLELMRLSNVALTGAGDKLADAFGRELPRLLEIARAAAKATGQDVDFLFSSLVTGIKRMSPLLIDNTGLQLKMGEANKALAEQLGKTVEELSGEEKQIAILNATLAAGDRMVREFGGAQLTAAEKIARAKASAQEMGQAVGSILLPTLVDGMDAVSGLAAGFADLPAPVQQTVVQFTALGGATLAVGGAVGMALPKIASLLGALQSMGGVALLGPAGLIAGMAALAIYSHNLEQAHQQEAASIMDAANSYREYTGLLRDAGLSSYALSEGLYDLAKAAQAAGEGFTALELQAARAEIEDTIVSIKSLADQWRESGGETGDLSASFDEMTSAMDDAQLAIAANRDEMYEVFRAMGYSTEQAQALAAAMREVALAEQAVRTESANYAQFETDRWRVLLGIMEEAQSRISLVGKAYSIAQEEADKMGGSLDKQGAAFAKIAEETGIAIDLVRRFVGELGYTEAELENVADDLAITGGEMDSLAEGTGFSREQIQYFNQELGMGEAGIKAYADALKAARDMMAEFVGSLAGGIVGLQDLDTKAVKSADDYEAALAKLGEKGKHVYDGLKTDFEASLPDATTVQERLGMAADAWDEWALRMGALMDGVQGIQEQGWLDTITQVTAGTDLAFQAGEESLAQWMDRLKEAFYAGDLQALINEDSQAWQDNAAATADAQAKATAAVEGEAAKRRAAIAQEKAELEAARAEQLAAEQAARDQAMLELSLDLAEASGMLTGWAQTTFGPEFAGAFDTAAEVVDGLKSGLLTLDGPLGEMVASFATGINDVLAETEGGGKTMADTLRTLLQGVDEEAATVAANVAEQLSTMGDDISVEDAKAAGKDLAEAMGGGIEEGLPEDPLAKMLAKFQGAAASIAEQSGVVKVAIETIPTEHTTDVKTKNVQNTLDLLEEVRKAIEAIPTDVKIKISAEYDPADEMSEPQSPKLGIQHALESLVAFVGDNFPLKVMVGSSGDVAMFKIYGEAINTLLQVLASIAGYAGGLAGIDAFLADVDQVLAALAEIQVRIGRLGFGMGMWAEGLGGGAPEPANISDVFGWVTDTVEALQAIGAPETEVDEARITAVFEDVASIIDHIIAIVEGHGAFATNVANWNPVAEGMEKIAAAIGPMALILEAVKGLQEYGGIGPGAIATFMADLSGTLEAIVDLAATYDNQDLGAATRLAATVSLIGSALGDAVEGLAAVGAYAGFEGGALELFEQDLPRLLDAMQRVAAMYEAEGLEAAADFSDAAGGIAADVGRAAGGIAELATYTGLQAGPLKLFERDLVQVLNALLRVAAQFEAEGVIAAEDLLDAATGMAGDAGRAVSGLIDLGTYTGLEAGPLALFERDLPLVLAALLRVAAEFEGEGVIAAHELARSALDVVSSVGQAAGSLTALGEYGGIAQAHLDLFSRDVRLALDALLALAAEYDREQVVESEEFAGAALAMVGNVGRAVQGLAELASYRGVSGGTVERFVADLDAVVSSLLAATAALGPAELARLTELGGTLSAVGGGIGAGFQALVDVATYRGGVELGLDAYVGDLGRLAAAYAGMEAELPPGETAESIGTTLEALSRGVTSAFDALVSVATYRGGIGQGLEAFISDIYLLITAFRELGDAVPWFFIPHSPPPLAQGLAAIKREMVGLAIAAPRVINQVSSPTINIGPNTVSGGIGLAEFEARVSRTVRHELGVN